MCENFIFTYKKFYQMYPNFYFPWGIPCYETNLNQNLNYQMIYPCVYQQNQLNLTNFLQSYSHQNDKFQRLQQVIANQKGTEDKKMIEITAEDEQQPNCQNITNSGMKMIPNKTRQKYGRNITSNIFRSLVKRVSHENRFKRMAVRIIQQNSFSITYEKFLEQINRLSVNLSSYVKKNEMRKFTVSRPHNNESKEFCTLFRILGKVYLRQQHTLNIFFSKKINRQSRSLHFVLARQMENMLK